MKNILLDDNKSIIDAMVLIESNNLGFCLVIDSGKVLKGSVTDGDIRRGLIEGLKLESSITLIMNKNFLSITTGYSLKEIIPLFQNNRIQFIPIIDNKDRIKNVITRRQFYQIMIKDLEYDLTYNFNSLDDEDLEYQIVNKPWGFYKIVFLNESSRVKVLKVYPGEELSLQRHKHRDEHWIIVNGTGELMIGEHKKNVKPGDYIWVPRGCNHQIKNCSEKSELTISEIQLGDSFDEEDIERISDKYNRV